MTRMLLFCFAAIFILVGCGNTIDEMSEDFDPVKNRQKEPVDSELDKKLGYVSYKKEEVQLDAKKNRVATMDRDEMADLITRMILRNDGFEEVATLVTDQEVLIVYEKNNEISAENAASLANKSAMSVLPRFFEVYVSDNASLIPDIHSLHNSTTTNKNYNNTLDRIKTEMKKAPQGNEDMNESPK
ncbi:MAG TPA: YhcN/YlaJ family sporulation lipoprotein [Bacillota bacterium]|nr:YhcN/YlaJ family sporulation lipoprotein [Bacillota bacterium]